MDVSTRIEVVAKQFERGLRCAGCSDSNIAQIIELIKQEKIDAIGFYASNDGFKVYEMIVFVDWNEHNKQKKDNDFQVANIIGLQKSGETSEVKRNLNNLVRKAEEKQLRLSYWISFSNALRIINPEEYFLLKEQLGFEDSRSNWMNEIGQDNVYEVRNLEEIRIRFRVIKDVDEQDNNRIKSRKALMVKCENVAAQLSCSKAGTAGDYNVDKNTFPLNVSLTFQGEKRAAMLFNITSLNDPTYKDMRQGLIVSLINKEEKLIHEHGGTEPTSPKPVKISTGSKVNKANNDNSVSNVSIDSIVSQMIDFVSKKVKKDDYIIGFNYSGIMLSKSGRSKLQQFLEKTGLNTKEYKIGNGSFEDLFLITVAVNHFPSIWRKKFQINTMIDKRLLKLLATIVDGMKNNSNIESLKDMSKQLDDDISKSILNRFNTKQLEELNKLLDTSMYGIADNKVSSFMDSFENWKTTVIKCAFNNAPIKSTEKDKLTLSTVDVGGIVDKYYANKAKHIKFSLIVNLICIAVLIAFFVVGKYDIVLPPWCDLPLWIPIIIPGYIYFFVGAGYNSEDNDIWKKYNQPLIIILIAGFLIAICSSIVAKMDKEFILFSEILKQAICYILIVSLFALSTAGNLKYLTEKNSSDHHLPLYKKLAFILCSVLAVLLLIGTVSSIKNDLEIKNNQVQNVSNVDNNDNSGGGWGDSANGRPSYTIEQINSGILGDVITFNSISDGEIGDEKNFVWAKISGENPTVWKKIQLMFKTVSHIQ